MQCKIEPSNVDEDGVKESLLKKEHPQQSFQKI